MYTPLDDLVHVTRHAHVSHKTPERNGTIMRLSHIAYSQNAHPSTSTRPLELHLLGEGLRVSKGARYDAVLIFSRTP